ncbi:hypothetical protein A6O26_07490 [Acidithiobacillus thiooxidans]|nr:hypothetical protein A6O26_07490 [Acidithiobacillus thiooxidans]
MSTSSSSSISTASMTASRPVHGVWKRTLQKGYFRTMSKTYLPMDVYTAARQRMERVFDDFPNVYLSFSAGKDSGVMLNLALEVAHEKDCLPLNVLILDLEAQYQHTADYIQRVADNPDVNLHWVCLPLHLRNAVSQIQPHWMCWDPDAKDL